jgi:hypothetical protein
MVCILDSLEIEEAFIFAEKSFWKEGISIEKRMRGV